MPKFTIKVPGSTANLGPGFDTLGCGLSLYLELLVTTSDINSITYQYTGPSTGTSVPLDHKTNLITKVAAFTASLYSKELPCYTLDINNQIPLSRGLGSSGSAIVGGILVCDVLLSLDLSRERVLEISTMMEGHGDNVGGSIYGSFILACPTTTLPSIDIDKPVQGMLEAINSTKVLVTNIKVNDPRLKAVVCIPDFELPTSKARNALPSQYPIQDIVFNTSRLGSLVMELQKEIIDINRVYEFQKDRVHHPYRLPLLYLNELPNGVCISGAGPTILQLCLEDYDRVGNNLVQMYREKGITAEYLVLDISSGYQIN